MVKFFVCGDIVNQTTNSRFVGDKLAQIISESDYSICNYEGPELKEGETASYPHQEPGTAAYLKQAGFDLMLLANNHITENDIEGVRYSIESIKRQGLDYVGAGLTWEEAYRPHIRDIKGKKFGFVNVCEAQVGQYLKPEQTFGYAWMGYDGLFDDVRKLSKQTEYVVVFVHAGLEHFDIPLPEYREFYKSICDAGASAVICSHPHCAQGYEFYDRKPIVYSLGNFFFPPREKWSQESHSYSVVLEFGDKGNVALKPVFHRNDGKQVEIDNESPVDLEKLNAKLGERYDQEVNIMVKRAYETLCKNLLIESTGGQNESDSFKQIVRRMLNYTLFRKKYVTGNVERRKALLLRLFENETYRWIIVRYLKSNYSE